MATRINTKFVIALVALVVVFGAAGAVAVKRLVFKSAAQHAKIADEALQRGLDAKEAGDFEVANSFFDQAARQYNAAASKDLSNTEYLLSSMTANESYVCTQATEAQNRLEMSLGASKRIHDVPGSSREERSTYYTLLYERHRSGLTIESTRPWIAYINRAARQELDANPDNDLSQYWRGISGVYMLRNDMPETERREPIEDLRQALERNPDDALLQHYLARWHYNEAERLKVAAGGETTEASTQQYGLGREASIRAYEMDLDDPANAYNHLLLLFATPVDDEVRDRISRVLLGLGRTLAADAVARNKLHTPELAQVITWLGRYTQLTGTEDPEPVELAVAIGEALVQDAPDHAEPHQLLAQARLLQNEYEQAINTLNDGLSTSRPLGPMEYMLDRQSRLTLLFTLAETYSTQAASLDAADPTRQALLDKAYETLERYRAAEGASDRIHVARADYLAGRAALIQNNPQAAIGFLEQANLVFTNRDLKTLTLLARAHDANGNSGEAIKYYELILQIEPRALTERLRLVRLYTQRGGGEALETADGHITQFLEYNPNHLEAWLIKANIYATAEQYATAAEIVKGLDLEKNPTLIAIHARYLAQAGETEEALRLVQERLAVEPNDTRAITVLFSLVTDKDEQLAELGTLEANGLKEETLRYYRTVIESEGQVPLDDLAELWESQGNSPLQVKKQMLTVYAQTGDLEKLREVLAELVEMAPDDKDVMTWQFNLAVNDKQWDEADRLVRAMLQLNPADRPTIAASNGAFLKAQVLTGRVLSDTPEGQTPDLREAVRAYRRALDDASTFVPGWIALGKLYMLEQDWQRARDAFNRAYNIQGTNVEATTLLARTMVQTGELDRALDLYREATRRQPNNRALLEEYLQTEARSGVRRLAMERREALRTANPNDTQNRRALAIMLAEDARYDEAIAEIDAIVEIEGASLSTVSARASVLAANDMVEEGTQALRDYIASLGEEAGEQDYVALALYLVRHNMQEDAEPVIQQAIALEDPATRNASRQWASILGQNNRLPEAARIYQDLIAAFPADSELKRQLATVYLAMGSYDQAQATLGGVPASANKEVLRAQVQMMQGKLDAALAIVRAARQAYEDNSALEVLEARVLTAIGEQALNTGDTPSGQSRLEEAIAIYERIVRRNASLYEYRVLIARLEAMLGRTEQAVSRLVRVIDENPEVTSARTTLYSLYMTESAGYATNDPRRQQLANSAYSVLTPLLGEGGDNDTLLRSAGQAAAEAGNPAVAARHYESAFAISENTGDLIGLIGALLAAQQPGEALVVLNRPDNAEHLANSIQLAAMRAQALANSNRGEEAANLFTNLLRRTDNPAELSMIISRIARSVMRDRAAEIVDAAIPAERMSPAIDLQLALIAQGRRDWATVIQRLTKYEDESSDSGNLMYQVHLSLALAYQESGGQDNLLRAKSIYETMLVTYGDNVELLNNLAYLLTDHLLGTNHAQAAVDYAERAIALLSPSAPRLQKAMLYDTLGWAQFKAGDLDAARASLRESIAFSPLAVNHKHLGLVHMAAGDKTLAISSMSQARSAARAANDTEQEQEIQGYLEQLRSQ